MASINQKESKPAEARNHAQAAHEMAVTIFGEGAGGTRGPKQVLLEIEEGSARKLGSH